MQRPSTAPSCRQRARLWRAQRDEVREDCQHPRYGRQLRRYRFALPRRKKVGAPCELEARPVFDQQFEARRPGSIAEPELDRGHRPEIADRPQARAVSAGPAPVERRRNGGGAIGVGERRRPRPVEADAAAQVVVRGFHVPVTDMGVAQGHPRVSAPAS